MGEAEALRRGNTVGVRDQIMDLMASQGQKVSRAEVNDKLLPTPNTMDSLPAREGDAYELNLRRGNPDGPRREMSGNLREVVIHDVLLPTVTTSEGTGAGKHGTGGDNLRTVASLLPTPTVSDQTGAASSEVASGNSKNRLKVEAKLIHAHETEWGKFEPAIRRWEKVLGRPAPQPTKPDGKDGAHRLSSKFTEWMMGLPEGWVTDCGLSRNAELKACGNGVVPQQAALALRLLIDSLALAPKDKVTLLPTPMVSDTFTDQLSSTQQTSGSLHSVTLPQAVKMLDRIAT